MALMFFMFFFLHSISKIGPKTKHVIRPWQVLSDAEYLNHDWILKARFSTARKWG